MYLERFSVDSFRVHELLREKSLGAPTRALPNTGHLVMALMEKRMSYAARILDRLGLRYSQLEQIEQMVAQHSSLSTLSKADILKQAVDLDDTFRMSAEYASHMRSWDINPEHLLVGLFCSSKITPIGELFIIDPDINRFGAQLISSFSITANEIDREVRKLTRPVRKLFELS